MYLINKQLHPSTTVDICLYCHFYNLKDRNLIVASNNVLKVYRLVTEVQDDPLSEGISMSTSEMPADTQSKDASKVKLECLQTFSFFGRIVDIKTIMFPGGKRETLLIAFYDAKLSILEYDPTTHDLKTHSLHYFEADEIKEGLTQFPGPMLLRVDPDGRCAALLVYLKNILIIPFKRDVISAVEEMDKSAFFNRSSTKQVLASYKLNLSDESYAGEKINNILDMEFLEGYYEPTLLILHEPIRTWSGRLAVRQDTVSMVSLSLNIHQKVHPIIWSAAQLPYDCNRAMAVPKPVGGVLIFASNSLTYLNQSVPPYSVSLNSFTEGTTAFSMTQQPGVKISLDASNACFISEDKLVISLKGGELYVLTLFNDGMRSIRRFHFEKAASSVMTTCLTPCEDGFLFLGSRLGNSLLLKYTEKPCEPAKEPEPEPFEEEEEPDQTSGEKRPNDEDGGGGEPESKVARIKEEEEEEEVNEEGEGDLGEWIAKDVALMAADDLEVYGEAQSQEEKLPTTFSFEVCDSIANIGPCGNVCMGEPAFLPEEFANTNTPHVDLVTTSGFSKNGALTLLQRTVRPQVLTTMHLPKYTDVWTVFDSNSESGQASKHSYLILSKTNSTDVFQTGQEINQMPVDQTGFNTQSATITCGNLGDNQFILQVTPSGARLLEGTTQVHSISFESLSSSIVSASLCDPYCIVLTAKGLVCQLQLKSEEKKLFVKTPKLLSSRSKVIAISLYKDVSGVFSTEAKVDDTAVKSEPDVPEIKKEEPQPAKSMIDDEDELLYGDTTVEDIAGFGAVKTEDNEKEKSRPEAKIHCVTKSAASFWLFVARENGVLEVYSLPDYILCYYVKNFPMASKVLVDSHETQKQQDVGPVNMPQVKEMVVVGLGVKESRPFLFIRLDEQIFIYEAFPFMDTQIENHLKIRFKKSDQTVILRKIRADDSEDVKTEEIKREKRAQVWFRSFVDVSGYSGVFLCGPYPTWFFMSSRGELRKQEMTIDGAITSFASFNNVNCNKGFIYFNRKDDLRIALLPTQVSYDASWSLRKVPIKNTAHFLNYHVDSKCYIVVTSSLEPVTKLVRIAGDEKDYEVIEREARDPRYITNTTEMFAIQLFSPVSWEVIPGTRVECEEWEHVTCLKNVHLLTEGTETGLKGFVAIGTNYCYGEDVTNRGRIWIMDIIDVVPEPGQPLTRNKIKMVYCKEQKGPVTALCQVKGFLLSAIGQKIYIWQLKEADLVGIAFIDTQIYIHSAVSIKSLILVADVYKSISLLRYQEETRTLALVSRDTRSYEVYGCHFVVDTNQLAFVVSDADSNLIVYSYNPDLRESYGGTRLIRRSDFHLGSRINSFFQDSGKSHQKQPQFGILQATDCVCNP